MKAPASCEVFLQLVRQSRLVDPSVLDDYARQLEAAKSLPGDPRPLAALMVRQGCLTYFQATQLLRGKYRGFLLGSYLLLERLGSGRSRLMFLAVDLVLRRRLALEVLPRLRGREPSALAAPEGGVGDLDHLNLVRACGTERVDNLCLRLWEYVDGTSLQDIVQERGPLDLLRAAHYTRQAADGLQHLHEAGLVHGRINPGNLLLDRRGTVKILEPALAPSPPDGGTRAGRAADDQAIVITPAYSAPEQARGPAPPDIRSDLYSLGATWFFLLTGRLPCAEDLADPGPGSNRANPGGAPKDRPDLPRPLRAVLARMLADDPARRFPIPADVAAALAAYTRTPIPPPADNVLPQLSPLARRDWCPAFQRIWASCSFPASPGGYGPSAPPPAGAGPGIVIDEAAAAEPMAKGPRRRKQSPTDRSVKPWRRRRPRRPDR
jgi:serine/threonine protein kinase